MPLFPMSANIQEGEAVRQKRTFDEYSSDAIKVDTPPKTKMPHTAAIQPSGDCLLPFVSQGSHQPSPQGSPALTEAGSSTPARNSPSPQTPTKSATQTQPSDMKTSNPTSASQQASTTQLPTAPKRRVLTPAEREARDKEAAEKKKEREENAALKAAEKAKQEEEKAARLKEREEARRVKAEEKAKQDEEKAARLKERDEKKRKREEEAQRAQEEKDKKARSQLKLNFFKVSTAAKNDDVASNSKTASPSKMANGTSPSKATRSQYEKMFQPFFVKENTRLATPGPNMDEETLTTKSHILDEYIRGDRTREHVRLGGFDAADLFDLPSIPPPRGRLTHPVKQIMETAYNDAEKLGGAGGVNGNNVLSHTRRQLAKVPMKVIAFAQDVRPPYYGTVTYASFAAGKKYMARLARRPTGRRLPLNYDYDSEAEWQEEEGEDVDMDDDEEELDEEDDMDEFLDDSEDAGLSRRLFANTMEPESTGICFEDEHRQGYKQATYEHKMEFIHENFDQQSSIDPFTTSYWEPAVKTKGGKGPQASETAVKMQPPTVPTNAFAALKGDGSVKLVKQELMNDVKQAILENKALSKIGIVDVIFQRFREKASRTEVKNTIEHVAERKGPGRQKEWELKTGHGVVA